MAKEVKISIKTGLFIIKNIRKTLKYWIKTILYNVLINLFFVYLYYKFININYDTFLSRFFSDLLPYVKFGTLFLIIINFKVILYGNVVKGIKKDRGNDFSDLKRLVLTRYFDVLGVLFLYFFIVLLFSILGIIPGIIYFFYYYFGIFFCAVGDLNEFDRDKKEPRVFKGFSSFSKSKDLVKGNLIRFVLLTIVVAFLTYFMQKYIPNYLITSEILSSREVFNSNRKGIWNVIVYRTFQLMLSDFYIIYSSLIYVKFQNIKKDIKDEQERKELEDQRILQDAMMQDRIRRKGK